MKFTIAVALAASLFATILANPVEGVTELGARQASNCSWKGTAPFCSGVCPPGTILLTIDPCGDGACCWTGYKAYCCAF